MSDEHSPVDPVCGQAIKVPCVAAILMNAESQVLLQLRDDTPGLAFAGCWSLPGGRVEADEDPETAIRRELLEELGIRPPVSLWKVYERSGSSQSARLITIVQFVYVGRTTDPIEALVLTEGQAIRYVSASEIPALPMGFDFETLLHDFFGQHRLV